MSLDQFSYLWDGSAPGWKLEYHSHLEWQVTFLFSPDGPTIEEVSKLRGLLDQFRDAPVSTVSKKLRGHASFELAGTLSNIEMHRLAEQAERAQLKVSIECVDRSGHLPVHADGSALIIEDDDLAEEVARRMIEAGVEVVKIEVD